MTEATQSPQNLDELSNTQRRLRDMQKLATEQEDKINELANQLASRPSGIDTAQLEARCGALYTQAERDVRLLSQDERISLGAAMVALLRVMAENEEKEASAEYCVNLVNRLKEEYHTPPSAG